MTAGEPTTARDECGHVGPRGTVCIEDAGHDGSHGDGYDGWQLAHPNGIGIGSCAPAAEADNAAEDGRWCKRCDRFGDHYTDQHRAPAAEADSGTANPAADVTRGPGTVITTANPAAAADNAGEECDDCGVPLAQPDELKSGLCLQCLNGPALPCPAASPATVGAGQGEDGALYRLGRLGYAIAQILEIDPTDDRITRLLAGPLAPLLAAREADGAHTARPLSPVREAALVLSDRELSDALGLWYAARRETGTASKAAPKDGLREALVQAIFTAGRDDNGTGSIARARMLADAVLAGPLAPLLTVAENATEPAAEEHSGRRNAREGHNTEDALREALVLATLRHWRTPTSGCDCGQVGLGLSWSEHIADAVLSLPEMQTLLAAQEAVQRVRGEAAQAGPMMPRAVVRRALDGDQR
jgi:hypothetical protein